MANLKADTDYCAIVFMTEDADEHAEERLARPGIHREDTLTEDEIVPQM